MNRVIEMVIPRPLLVYVTEASRHKHKHIAECPAYAHRRDSEFHRAAGGQGPGELAEGRAQWALPWAVPATFFSIVTHPRIYDPPSGVDQALSQIDAAGACIGRPPQPRGTRWAAAAGSARSTGRLRHPPCTMRPPPLLLTHGVGRDDGLWTHRFPRLRTVSLRPLSPWLSASRGSG